MRITACLAVLSAVVALVGSAAAQNRTLPSTDWSSNWGFASPSQQVLLLQRADLIEKQANDYWATAGQTTVNNTTSIGAYNHTEINQDLSNVTLGEGATISNEGWADASDSCQNASINIATGGGDNAAGC